tara:strand:+ start:208 stop:429 length:222 start_codon:yes stop_codon:yes gene_type:complete
MLNKFKDAIDGTDIKDTSDPHNMIALLRINLLFQKGVDPDEYGEEASYHYLAGLAQLELAIAEMKLFHLKAHK